ncbi:hypothetical protein OHA88_03890 [Streptomyces sp. NBC_00353]|uniref:hypothetical protein n=1 Tax=Streptomyces sp. NBC_00353 TaxID=2975722 RepID=UPI002E2719DD
MHLTIEQYRDGKIANRLNSSGVVRNGRTRFRTFVYQPARQRRIWTPEQFHTSVRSDWQKPAGCEVSTHNLALLLVAVAALAAVSGPLGVAGHGLARAVGLPVTVTWAGVVFVSAMALFIALLAVIVSTVT